MARRGSPFFNGFPIIGKFDPLTAHLKDLMINQVFFLFKAKCMLWIAPTAGQKVYK